MNKQTFDQLVAELHSIATAEFKNLSIFETGMDSVNDTVVFLMNVNSNGLLSETFLDQALKLYAENSNFRHLWGSISTNLEIAVPFMSGMDEDPSPLESVSHFVLETLTLAKNEGVNTTPLGDAQLQSSRLDFVTRHTNTTLTNPADWWLVCLMLFRLTMHKSDIVAAFTNVAAKKLQDLEGSRSKMKRSTPATFSNTSSAPAA